MLVRIFWGAVAVWSGYQLCVGADILPWALLYGCATSYVLPADKVGPWIEKQLLSVVWIRRAVCRLLGHKYKVVRNYTPAERRICCTRCGEQFAMNDRVQTLLPWDSDFAEMYGDYA